jgi:hypothetical protein
MGIIDDQNDWYDVAGNNWIPEHQRKAAAKQAKLVDARMEEAKNTVTLSLDPANRTATVKRTGAEAANKIKHEEAKNASQFLIEAAK